MGLLQQPFARTSKIANTPKNTDEHGPQLQTAITAW